MSHQKPSVALIQTSPEVARQMQVTLEDHGFRVFTYIPHDFMQRHQADILNMLEENQPDAWIFDVVTPYFENWEVFQDIRDQSKMGGKPYLITTIDKNLLENVTSEPPYFEIRGSSFNTATFYETFRKIYEAQGSYGLKRGSLMRVGLRAVPKRSKSESA